MTFAGVDPIYEPIPVRPGRPLPHGRRRDRRLGRDRARGPLRGRRVACVSVHGANRLGGNSLMETITFGRRAGTARRRVGARRHTTGRRPPRRRSADAERELKTLLDRSDGRAAVADPRRARPVDARELRRLPPRGADATSRSRSSTACASATTRVVVEDKGDVFNSDLTQAIELGYLLDLAACMVAGRGRAQGEPRRPRAPVRLPGPRRRELPEALDHALGRRRRRSSRTEEVTMTKWQPQERKY